MTDIPDEELPPALKRVTLVDRLVRFVFGAVPAVAVMLALSPLLEPLPLELFVLGTAVAALTAGGACAAWGDRFLVPLLRAIGRDRVIAEPGRVPRRQADRSSFQEPSCGLTNVLEGHGCCRGEGAAQRCVEADKAGAGRMDAGFAANITQCWATSRRACVARTPAATRQPTTAVLRPWAVSTRFSASDPWTASASTARHARACEPSTAQSVN